MFWSSGRHRSTSEGDLLTREPFSGLFSPYLVSGVSMDFILCSLHSSPLPRWWGTNQDGPRGSFLPHFGSLSRKLAHLDWVNSTEEQAELGVFVLLAEIVLALPNLYTCSAAVIPPTPQFALLQSCLVESVVCFHDLFEQHETLFFRQKLDFLSIQAV